MTAPYAEVYPSAPVDDVTAALLDDLADTEDPDEDTDVEWARFLRALRLAAAENGGRVDPNRVRVLLARRVRPGRVGSFYRRAVKGGLLRVDGWNLSDDLRSRNSGKPQRKYRWSGGDLDAAH